MLNERDREILDFERQWFKYAGAKEQEIRSRFGVTPTRYYQRLNLLLDEPDTLAYAPLTVNRLQRLRDARRTPCSPSSTARLGA